MNARRMTGVIAAVLTVGFFACDAGQTGGEAGDAAADTAAEAPAMGEATDTMGQSESMAQPVRATLSEWDIELASDTLSAGMVSFNVVNEGEYAHVFEVEGQGEEWVTDEIAAGEQVTLTADLAAGTYEVYCPLDNQHGNHSEQGMTTELVVR